MQDMTSGIIEQEDLLHISRNYQLMFIKYIWKNIIRAGKWEIIFTRDNSFYFDMKSWC
jgi:hypothetical protein